MAYTKKNIDLIIASFEADAQLAYLNRIGLLNAILTVEADLIAFAVLIRCPLNVRG